jgi:hypothetical protein
LLLLLGKKWIITYEERSKPRLKEFQTGADYVITKLEKLGRFKEAVEKCWGLKYP